MVKGMVVMEENDDDYYPDGIIGSIDNKVVITPQPQQYGKINR